MNDIADDRTDIKFGQKPHQVLRPDVAERMLEMLHDRNPAQFGALLAEVMTGVKPRAGRGVAQ